MPKVAAVTEAAVAAVTETAVVIEVAVVMDVAAVFAAMAAAGDGVATQDRAAITAIAGAVRFAPTKFVRKYPNPVTCRDQPPWRMLFNMRENPLDGNHRAGSDFRGYEGLDRFLLRSLSMITLRSSSLSPRMASVRPCAGTVSCRPSSSCVDGGDRR